MYWEILKDLLGLIDGSISPPNRWINSAPLALARPTPAEKKEQEDKDVVSKF